MTILEEGRPEAPAATGDFASFAAAVEAGVERQPVGPIDADELLAAVPGLEGDADVDEVPLRQTLATWGAAPLGVLFALNVVDELDRVALTVLAPNVRDAFGLSTAGLTAIATIGGLMSLLVALPLAALADRRSRTRIAAVTGLIWGGFAAATGFAVNTATLVLARIGAGSGKASVEPVHPSLLADYYPVASRGPRLRGSPDGQPRCGHRRATSGGWHRHRGAGRRRLACGVRRRGRPVGARRAGRLPAPGAPAGPLRAQGPGRRRGRPAAAVHRWRHATPAPDPHHAVDVLRAGRARVRPLRRPNDPQPVPGGALRPRRRRSLARVRVLRHRRHRRPPPRRQARTTGCSATTRPGRSS